MVRGYCRGSSPNLEWIVDVAMFELIYLERLMAAFRRIVTKPWMQKKWRSFSERKAPAQYMQFAPKSTEMEPLCVISLVYSCIVCRPMNWWTLPGTFWPQGLEMPGTCSEHFVSTCSAALFPCEYFRRSTVLPTLLRVPNLTKTNMKAGDHWNGKSWSKDDEWSRST